MIRAVTATIMLFRLIPERNGLVTNAAIGKTTAVTAMRFKIPLTNELILFFAATFVYNLCNIVDICFGGMPTAFSHYCISIGVFFYYASGEFQTLLFLYVIKKYVADKLDSLWIKRSVFAFGVLQIPNILFLLITPFTGFLYYIDTNNDYVRRWEIGRAHV